jgi:hypothetical protein
MKLAYPIDEMLQVEVVGDTPSGAVVAVEPAQAREAWASILESKRWLDIRAGYGQDPSGFIVRLQTNVEEIPPNKIVFWMTALVPPGEPNGEPELRDVILLGVTRLVAPFSPRGGRGYHHDGGGNDADSLPAVPIRGAS